MKDYLQNAVWKMSGLPDGKTTTVTVPGDVTVDLFKAGVISDPYFGMNYKEALPLLDKDYSYSTTFSVDKPEENQFVKLELKGVDLFADVFVNGKKVGSTDNMFVAFSFDVTDFVTSGTNTLEIALHSTTAYMNTLDCKDYFATFNLPRIFLRKAQCHFGWDWAPRIPGYGIYKPVTVTLAPKIGLDNVRIETFEDGDVVFHTELNCGRRADNSIYDGWTVKYSVAAQPNCEIDGKTAITREVRLEGAKSFVTLNVPNCEKWWPNGYGKANCYAYHVELFDNGKFVSELNGVFAFKTVTITEKPIGGDRMTFIVTVNGKPIYLKGGNWVPAECFTGNMKAEKYQKLVSLAKAANYNVLRVWGGGIYEDDLFYDLCDKNGLLVWQDFMFACGDLPDDDVAFLKNVEKEAIYQIKRLRNHPCLLLWCGCNEKTGCYGYQISHGDYIYECLLSGLTRTYDAKTPYIRQSPFSYSDSGNDLRSGESHCCSFEEALLNGFSSYRDLVCQKIPAFTSECAVMGPSSVETLKKIFPQDKLWPTNEYWEDRLMDNPYAAVLMTFTEREKLFAKEMFGESANLEDFVRKAMAIQGEGLRMEIDHSRAHKWVNAGILNWMFDDIWPSATWAIVDYFGEPKQGYYEIRRSFRPVNPIFYRDANKNTNLVIVNDTANAFSAKVEYGERTLDGKTVTSYRKTVRISANSVAEIGVVNANAKGNYLFATIDYEDETVSTTYNDEIWKGVTFKKDYSVMTQKIGKNKAEIKIKANSYARCVRLAFPENFKYRFSDNYFDVEAKKSYDVTVEADCEIDLEKLEITDFSDASHEN